MNKYGLVIVFIIVGFIIILGFKIHNFEDVDKVESETYKYRSEILENNFLLEDFNSYKFISGEVVGINSNKVYNSHFKRNKLKMEDYLIVTNKDENMNKSLVLLGTSGYIKFLDAINSPNIKLKDFKVGDVDWY